MNTNSAAPMQVAVHYFETPKLELLAWFLCENADVLVVQLCPTLCNPIDYSPPGSSVHRGSPKEELIPVLCSSQKPRNLH